MDREVFGGRGSLSVVGGRVDVRGLGRQRVEKSYAAHADPLYRKGGGESSGGGGKGGKDHRVREDFKDYAAGVRKQKRRGRDSDPVEPRERGRSHRNSKVNRDYARKWLVLH